MKPWFLGASALAALLGAAMQTDGGAARPDSQKTGLVKVPPPAERRAGDAVDAVEAWRKALTDPDLDRREQAFSEAADAAALDPIVRQALEGFARDESADAALAWTARLALRESETAAAWPRAFGGRYAAPQVWQPYADDLRRIEELLAQRLGNAYTPTPPQAAPQSGDARFERFQLEVGPDGVKCTVHENVDGRETSQTYTYDSVEQLLEEHPELADRIQIGGDLGHAFRLGGGALDSLAQPWWGTPGRRAAPATPRDESTLRTDVLGVVVHPLDAARAAELGLDPGVGLVVERVEPRTIAKSLGVERGHVLVELNGRPLRTHEDISEVVRARAADGPIAVVLFDRWGQRRERTWKPDAAREL